MTASRSYAETSTPRSPDWEQHTVDSNHIPLHNGSQRLCLLSTKATPEHILQDWPKFVTQRMEIWITEQPYEKNLWGTGEDLRHTFLIMTHEGIMNHGPWGKIRNYIANADLNKENEIEARLALSNHPVFLKKLMIINIFVSYKQQCNCLNTNRMFNTLMSS